jgi:glycosyltransferase involved in cell wall biosynthesis
MWRGEQLAMSGARALVVNPGTHPEVFHQAVALSESGWEVDYATATGIQLRPRLKSVVTASIPRFGRDHLTQRILPCSFSPRARAGFGYEMLFQAARRLTPKIAPSLLRRRNSRLLTHLDEMPEQDYRLIVAQQGAALGPFQRWPNAKRVLNAPIAHPVWSDAYLRAEMDVNPAWASYMQLVGGAHDEPSKLAPELAMADIVLVASSFSEKTYRESGVGNGKLRVLSLGSEIPPAQSAQPPRLTGEPLKVLFAGQVNQRKGFGYFVEALENLDNNSYTARAAGPISHSHRDLVQKVPIVKFLGALSRNELFRQYTWADLVVLPSLIEGFGLTALEAMAHGRPVVVSAHTFATDLIVEGVNGFVVPPQDAKALANTIDWVARNPGAADQIGVNARETQSTLTWKLYRSRFAKIVKQFL